VNKKLEITDKTVDFQDIARKNQKNAYVWAALGGLLILITLIILQNSLSDTTTFSDISQEISKSLENKKLAEPLPKNQKLPINTAAINKNVETVIYFTFIKYCITKAILYSMLIYSIILCVKNYNAQMHNHIINIHKSNALKSTLN